MADLLNSMATHLIAQQPSFVLDENLFLTFEQPADGTVNVPVAATFMYESDGFWIPRPYMGPPGSAKKKTFDQTHVVVIVRQLLHNYTAGRLLFDQIIEGLDLANFTIDNLEFMWCRALKPKPLFKGPNRANQLIWELGFEVATLRDITSNS